MKKGISVLLFPLIFLGCQRAPNVSITKGYDDVSQITRCQLRGNVIQRSPESRNSHWTAIDFFAEHHKNENWQYYVVVSNRADGDDTMWIRIGESLIFNADGDSIALINKNSPIHFTSPMYVYSEMARYEVSREIINKLISTKNLKFKIYGERGNIGGVFSDIEKQRINEFCANLPVIN